MAAAPSPVPSPSPAPSPSPSPSPDPAPDPAPARAPAPVMIVDDNASFLISTASILKDIGISAIMVQNRLFAAKLLRIAHPTTHHCSSCSDVFDSAEEERQHASACTLKSRFLELYKPKRSCQLCTEANNFASDKLGRHSKERHGTRCGQCSEELPTTAALSAHIADHAKEDKRDAQIEKRNLLQQKLSALKVELRKVRLLTKPGLVLASEASGIDAIRTLGQGKVPIVVLAQNENVGPESYAGAQDFFRLPLRDGDLAKIQQYIQ